MVLIDLFSIANLYVQICCYEGLKPGFQMSKSSR